MSVNAQFFWQLLRATAPLLLWAAHFTVCYVLVAAQCSPALYQPGAPSRAVLGMVSALALGVCLWMLWRARAPRRLLDWAMAGSAALALAGIAWTSVPVLMLAGCG